MAFSEFEQKRIDKLVGKRFRKRSTGLCAILIILLLIIMVGIVID